MSSDLYDAGYTNIRNLDFSNLVIDDMRRKNEFRPNMSWDTGDMTHMDLYEDKSFHIVLDKGALDALMSVDDPNVRVGAINMFNEIDRVLTDSGKYICITLAEGYILDTILDYFISPSEGLSSDRSSRWCLSVEVIEGLAPSPFKPLLLLISKVKSITSPLAGIDMLIHKLFNQKFRFD